MVDLSKINRIDEARYSKRQELDFVIRNRRNRLIGLWAGQKLGMDEKDAAGYATDIVGEAIVAPGDANLVKMITRDLAKGGVVVSEAELGAELERLHRVAAMEFGETGEKSPRQPHAA